MRTSDLPPARLMAVVALAALVLSSCHLVSYRAGVVDEDGTSLGGTEIMDLTAHDGSLFAGTSVWNETASPAQGQVLRLDAPNGAWVADSDWGPTVRRVQALESFTFTTDGEGTPLDEPARVLVAALAVIGDYSVAVRDDATGEWTLQPVAPGDTFNSSVRALGFLHDDGVDRIFAGFGTPATGRWVMSGTFDPATGTIDWEPVPEVSALDGRPLGFAEANDVLHLVAGSKVYARAPGDVAWNVVHTDPETAACVGSCAGLRGITAIPDADGTGEDLLIAGRFDASSIWRLDPERSYAPTEELDVDEFVRIRFGDDADASVVAYNEFEAAIHPSTGEPFHFVSLLFFPGEDSTVDQRQAAFLVRDRHGAYELREVPWLEQGGADPAQLRSTRTFETSPFGPDGGAWFYTGGYDAFTPSHDTAWINRALLAPVAPTAACLVDEPSTPPPVHDVGIVDTTDQIIDPSRDRTLPLRIRYPVDFEGAAPVVVISHGGTGNPNSHYALSYLGEALAGAGYVAIHPNHTSTRPRIDRPLDVQFLFDLIESGPPDIPGFAGSLDPTRMAVAGHSWGSYTALSIAGASPDDLGAFGTDERAVAALGLSPQGAGQFGFVEGSWTAMTRPTYTLYGELEADGSVLQTFADEWRRQPYDGMPAGNKYVSRLPDASHSDLGGGTSAVAVQTEEFVAANAIAFFDTYVRGMDRRCEIGNLAVPEGAYTDRK